MMVMKMNKLLLVFGCFSLILLSYCTENEPTPDQAIEATAILSGIYSETDSTYVVGEEPYGRVQLTQLDSIVQVEIFLENFNPNTIHSVHLHAGSCEQPGMHWNQGFGMDTYFCNERSLGIPWAKPRAGDVGNVSVGYDGSGYFSLKTDMWQLGSGDHRDIVGKVVVIHDTLDDFVGECDPNHTHNHTHTNAKVACGTIELVQN